MAFYEWIILAAIAAVCVYACWAVNDERKKGRNLPGPLCGGNPHAGTPCPGQDDEHQIML